MGAAPGVQGVGEVGVAVAHEGARVLGQDPAVVDVGLRAAAGVHRGQPLGRGDVHVAQVLVGAGGGLVDV
jgi:hypothetical protein